jgi:hypothetical protein
MNRPRNTGSQTTDPVRPREISGPLDWARTITQAGPAADPAEQTAYLAAKADLLARIATTTGDPAAANTAAAASAAARAADSLKEAP